MRAGVPITNYGLTIAYALGVFERALSPFPAALEVYRRERANARASAGPHHISSLTSGPEVQVQL